MSLETEKLVLEMADAGIVFYRSGGTVTMQFHKGFPGDELMRRVRENKAAIQEVLDDRYRVLRCVGCEYYETCGGECLLDTPG